MTIGLSLKNHNKWDKIHLNGVKNETLRIRTHRKEDI